MSTSLISPPCETKLGQYKEDVADARTDMTMQRKFMTHARKVMEMEV